MDRAFARYLLLASLAALPAMITLGATYFVPGPTLLEQRGYYVGLDFVNYWTGARLALGGDVSALYDVAAYNALLREWFAPAKEFMIFSYPPNALALLAPVGLLPYLVALPLWLALGVVLFLVAALGGWPRREDAALLVAIALSPIIWVNLTFGQLGLVLAFLFVGALRILPTRPLLAGVMIGLMTIKPQLGPLLALTLAMTGAWRAFLAAAVTAAALIVASLILYGVEPWQAWWGETARVQLAFLSQTRSFFVTQMATPYGALRLAGVPVDAALAVQAVVAVLVVAATWVVLAGEAPWPLKAAVVAFGAVLIPPYVLAYDLAIPLAALVWCLREGSVRASVFGVAAAAFVWAVPFGLTLAVQCWPATCGSCAKQRRRRPDRQACRSGSPRQRLIRAGMAIRPFFTLGALAFRGERACHARHLLQSAACRRVVCHARGRAPGLQQLLAARRPDAAQRLLPRQRLHQLLGRRPAGADRPR